MIIKLSKVYGSIASVYSGSQTPPFVYLNKEQDKIISEKQRDDLIEPFATEDLGFVQMWKSLSYTSGLGKGNLYGPGLYTVFDLDKSKNTKSGEYGPFVYKFAVNLNDYLIFDKDIADIVYPEYKKLSKSASIKTQLKRFGIENNFQFRIELEDPEENEYNEEYEDLPLEDEFLENATYTSQIAKIITDNGNVGTSRGLVFTGANDGKVCVVFDWYSAHLLSVASVSKITPLSEAGFSTSDTYNRFDLKSSNPTGSKKRRGPEELKDMMSATSNPKEFIINKIHKYPEMTDVAFKALAKKDPLFFISNYYNSNTAKEVFQNINWQQLYESALKYLSVLNPKSYLANYHVDNSANFNMAIEFLATKDPILFLKTYSDKFPQLHDKAIASFKTIYEIDDHPDKFVSGYSYSGGMDKDTPFELKEIAVNALIHQIQLTSQYVLGTDRYLEGIREAISRLLTVTDILQTDQESITLLRRLCITLISKSPHHFPSDDNKIFPDLNDKADIYHYAEMMCKWGFGKEWNNFQINLRLSDEKYAEIVSVASGRCTSAFLDWSESDNYPELKTKVLESLKISSPSEFYNRRKDNLTREEAVSLMSKIIRRDGDSKNHFYFQKFLEENAEQYPDVLDEYILENPWLALNKFNDMFSFKKIDESVLSKLRDLAFRYAKEYPEQFLRCNFDNLTSANEIAQLRLIETDHGKLRELVLDNKTHVYNEIRRLLEVKELETLGLTVKSSRHLLLLSKALTKLGFIL